MERDKDDLLQGLLQPDDAADEAADAGALVTAAEAQPPVVAVMTALRPFMPDVDDEELADFFRFALLGVSVGFCERNLSPRDEAHLRIIPPLLADIRLVYDQLRKMGAEYDREEFRYRAYDYGIHKAYYLDWQLYLSKELY
jgi:hypothetical protein